jgi:hypothetical protein
VLPFVPRPALIGGDEPHYALAAYSLAIDRDIDLANNYREVAEGSKAAGRKHAGTELDQHIRMRHGRLVFMHPLGLPALLAPLVWLQQTIAPGSPPDFLLAGSSLTISFLALLAGWSAIRRYTGDPQLSAFVALGIFFSTPIWFYSRTFFTEPYIWSLVVLATAGIASSRWLAAGIALGLAFLMKETAALIVLPVLVFVMSRYGVRKAAALAVGPGVALVAFLAKNTLMYGSVLVTFQAFERGSLLHGLIGLIVDIEHGVLWFAPLLIVASLGWIVALRRSRELNSELLSSLATAAAFYGLTALWVDWRGGSCYGPRLLVPIMPLLAIPLIRLWREGGPWLRGAAVFAALVGITVQMCAALHPSQAFWSASVGDLLLHDALTRLVGVAVAAYLLWRIVPRDRKS